MNRNKTSFVQNTQQKINITPYWLLGFIEGDGSFGVSKTNLVQAFELGITLREEPVIKAIYIYLNNLIPQDLIYKNKLQNPIKLRIRPSTGINRNPIASLKFVDMIYITKVFVPFLDKLIFLSKKV